jgi:nucleolar protein 15
MKLLEGIDSDEDLELLLNDSDWPKLRKDNSLILLDSENHKKLEHAASKAPKSEERGVVFLGRIPHGFYESEMKEYFSQFGKVTRLRLSRNTITGRSKHYAFIEFESAAVAQIVADTMNNYLLLNRVLKCEVVPKEKLHPKIFKHSFSKKELEQMRDRNPDIDKKVVSCDLGSNQRFY